MARTRSSFPGLLAATFAVATGIASAQCPTPSWQSMNRLPGLDVMGATAASTIWDPDGAGPAPPVLVVGGNFNVAGDVAAARVVTWNGAAWQALGSGVLDGDVSALAVYNGELIAGGQFGNVGGIATPNIARWNGTAWQPLGGGVGGRVRALAVYNNELIAAGDFSVVSGAQIFKIARWNGATWQAMGWMNVGGSQINALTVYNGELIVGGAFAGGSLLRWNGTIWQTFGLGGSGIQMGSGIGSVFGLTVFNGELIAGGLFDTAGGLPMANVGRWNGTTWLPMGPGCGSIVRALSTYNGAVIVGGTFTNAGGIAANRIASWNGAWQALGSGLNSEVSAMSVFGSELIAAGSFTTAGGPVARNVARWNGGAWISWPGEINGPVNAFTEFSGELILGGQEVVTTPAPRGVVRRWSGGTWQPVGVGMDNNPPSSPAATISALAIYNGEIVAAGSFTQADGSPAANIARWTGSGWVPLGSGLNGPVNALTIHNGNLIAGGSFTMAGAVSAGGIALWNGSSWQSLGGPAGTVYSVGVWNGQLVAGTQNDVRAWNGAVWQTFGVTAGIGRVKALATYAGELVIGGDFSGVAGITAPSVARWNGTTWQPLAAGLSMAIPLLGVASLTVYNGELIASGAFTNSGGAPLTGLAAWNGSAWHAVDPVGNGVNSTINTLTVYGGALLAGGAFTTAAGGTVASPYVARRSSPLPLVRASQPNGNGTGVQIDNRWLVPGHEYFNIFSTDICGMGPGTGPYGGLCANNFASLVQQALLPLGAAPFHHLATGGSATFGPYPAPVGLTFDVLCIDSVNVATGSLGCLSAVSRYTVN